MFSLLLEQLIKHLYIRCEFQNQRMISAKHEFASHIKKQMKNTNGEVVTKNDQKSAEE